MPYLQTLPPEDAAGEVKAVYDKDLAAQGYVANYTRTFSRRPDVLRAWQALKDAIAAGVDPRVYELATVAAATAIRSSYCSLVHGQILAGSYYPAGTVASIADGDPAETMAAADAAEFRSSGEMGTRAGEGRQGRTSCVRLHWAFPNTTLSCYSMSHARV